MRRSAVLGIVLILLSALPAAAGASKSWRQGMQTGELPFSRSERAQAVWDSGACWSACGSYCAWGQAECLRTDPQGRCLSWTNACDRACQRECRTGAGPLLPID